MKSISFLIALFLAALVFLIKPEPVGATCCAADPPCISGVCQCDYKYMCREEGCNPGYYCDWAAQCGDTCCIGCIPIAPPPTPTPTLPPSGCQSNADCGVCKQCCAGSPNYCSAWGYYCDGSIIPGCWATPTPTPTSGPTPTPGGPTPTSTPTPPASTPTPTSGPNCPYWCANPSQCVAPCNVVPGYACGVVGDVCCQCPAVPTPPGGGQFACFSCGFSFPETGCAGGNIVWEGWLSSNNSSECYGPLAVVRPPPDTNLNSCRADYECTDIATRCGGDAHNDGPDREVGWSTCRRPEITGNLKIINPTDNCSAPGRVPDQEEHGNQEFGNAVANAFKLCKSGTDCLGANQIPLDGGACSVLTHTDSGRGYYGCYVSRDIVSGEPGDLLFPDGTKAELRLGDFNALGERWIVKCPLAKRQLDLTLRLNQRTLTPSVPGPGVIQISPQNDFKVAIYVPPAWMKITGGDVHSNRTEFYRP